VAKYRFETGHNIDFSNISILDKATGYMAHVMKEAIEIKIHPSNFNSNGGFTLSHSWYQVMNMMKQYRDTLTQKQGQATQAFISTH
jgi:hypothetical protein